MFKKATRSRVENKSNKAKAFNQFVRAKHTGVTPYRPNFNIKKYQKPRARKALTAKRALGFVESTNPESEVQQENSTPIDIVETHPMEEAANGPTFQRNRLTSETQRLSQLADRWDDMKTSENVPESIKSDIDAVVGGTRLLISSKFQQFALLIDDAVNQIEGGPLITAEDLDGFWDMMSIQVKNLDKKFENLQRAERDGWSVEASPVLTRRQRRKAVKPKGVSKFKEFLQGKMKRKKSSVKILSENSPFVERQFQTTSR